MRHNARIFILLVWLAAGCATQPPPTPPLPSALFPADALVTQRAILTARGRQFALTGYTVLSKDHGMRLIISEMFGQTLADVLVQRDGNVRVMQSSPLLREKWIARYVAEDLRCVFDNAHAQDCHVEMLSPTHFVVKRRWYSLDLRVVEIKAGAQPAELFDGSGAKL
jgi:hypothetical protein